MSEKFRRDRKIGFQNTFYTKCINVIIESIGPSIILRSIQCAYRKNIHPPTGGHVFMNQNNLNSLSRGSLKERLCQSIFKLAWLTTMAGHVRIICAKSYSNQPSSI